MCIYMYTYSYIYLYIYIHIFSDTWMARNAHIKHSGFYTLIYCLHVCYSANLMSSI